MKKTLFVLAVFVAALLAGLFLSNNALSPARENFAQKSVGAPVSGTGMGPYDGVSLPGVAAGWMANDGESAGASPVDDGPPPMNLSGNVSSAACCPSSISTDAGCLCLNESDKALFASRGGNRGMSAL